MSNELQSFDTLKAEIIIFASPIKDVVVSDDKSMSGALEIGKQVKSMLKKVEARRVELTKPLLDQKKKIDTYASEISESLELAEKHLKTQLVSYQKVLEQKRIEEMKRIEAEKQEAIKKAQAELKAKQEEQATLSMFSEKVEDKKTDLVIKAEAQRLEKEILDTEKQRISELGASRIEGSRKIWKYEITNATLVPPIYWIVDEKAIGQAVRAGVKDIPGVRIYEETSISLGGR